MLFRKGFFTRLDDDRTGVNGHNANEIYFWRRVIDEQVIAAIGTNKEDREAAYRWFHSKKGDKDFFVADETANGYIKGKEYEVDLYDEFCETCDLANLDPKMVTEAFDKIVAYIKKEELNQEKGNKKCPQKKNRKN